MRPERWQQVKKVLAAALQHQPAERQAYLDLVCTEPSVRREVESLIAAHEQGDSSFMEHPAMESEALKSGTNLGPYEILAPLGAGGMGEVYQAHDTKLGRDVAIKVLPSAFIHDPDRLSRFQREARMLAALNHPNIATIHGLEQSEGVHYLVMELVHGQTLAERVTGSALRIEEALKVAGQIAEALEAAHEKGVIHRDLKPANVKVTPEGRVKVLDFGLAKALAGDSGLDLSHAPTPTAMGTEEGRILGTPAYMSPEQARGGAVDKRTDIWAFGCVLYELLTARQAFRGETVSDTIAAVLEREPDLQLLPPATPAQMRDLLRRCLHKDPQHRLRDIGDARVEIEEASAAPAMAEPTAAAQSIGVRWRGALLWGVAFLLLAAVTSIAVWNRESSSPIVSGPVSRIAITLPPGQPLAGLEIGLAVALSPDGTRLVYAARQGGIQQLYLRPLAGLEAQPIPGTEGATEPFFSPDGQWLGFFAGGKVKKVLLSGGEALSLGDASDPRGASWSSKGMIIFSPTRVSGLQQVSAVGGTPQPLTRLEKDESSHRWPEFLPGGNALLFAAGYSGANWSNAQIAVQSVGAGERRNLIQGGTHPHYAASGHLIYAQRGNLMAVPFDAQRLEITGAAVPVVENVLQSALSGAAQYSFSATGSLVYVPGGVQATQRRLVWVNRNGAEQPLAAPAHGYRNPRLSPDGRWVAVTIEEPESQVWLYNLARETLTRFTLEGDSNQNQVWTPDGKRIGFTSSRKNSSEKNGSLSWQLADGSGGLEELATEGYGRASSWSPDGQLLISDSPDPTTGYDIWVLRLGDSKGQPFLRTLFNEGAPRFSPDGRWVAYISDESGRYEVYVQPYPGPGGKWQISTEGGTEPVWNRNGRELFYRSGNKMMAVEITTQPNFSAGKPKVLFAGQYQPTPILNANYDVSPDGQRFLMVKPSEAAEAAPTQINVVLNWFEELKKKVPTGKK